MYKKLIYPSLFALVLPMALYSSDAETKEAATTSVTLINTSNESLNYKAGIAGARETVESEVLKGTIASKKQLTLTVPRENMKSYALEVETATGNKTTSVIYVARNPHKRYKNITLNIRTLPDLVMADSSL